MNKRQKLYLAIALTTECNYKCFYCKKTGESISGSQGTLNFENLKRIIKASYKMGIKKFRITGGEPTLVEYLPELIEFVMNFAEDTTIRLNTNGYNLYSLLDLIAKYKERIYVMISVDSLSENLQGFNYPKFLSKRIENLAREMVKRGIGTRFNVVVTKMNVPEVPQLISRALDLGVDIKLLDFNLQEEYLHANDQMSAREFWEDTYESLGNLKESLKTVADEFHEEYSQSNSNGISMSAFFKGSQMIQFKDSNNGASYSDVCIEKCPFFDSCRDGVFSPLLSVGEVLHLSGCKNKELRWNLKGMSESEIEKAFQEVLSLFENTRIVKH